MDDVPEGTPMFDNFFGTFDGRHLLLLVIVVLIGTAIKIMRSPQASVEPEAPTEIYCKFLSYPSRAHMAGFIADVLGYGHHEQWFRCVRESNLCTMAPAYARLVDAIKNARRTYGLSNGKLTYEDRDRLVGCLVDDRDFILACVDNIAFIDAMVDYSYTVTSPDNQAIPDSLIPNNAVLASYCNLRDALWPPANANA